ncbi:RING-type E3 ubiquitin transferase [Sarracenia purpurea var. burkii]
MANFVPPLENPSIISSGSYSRADDDDDSEDTCSICLEPFNSQDPPTVTNCRHDYHLQCILEWSQRSKECPICWQPLVLRDPTSQELLAAVENERNLRSRHNSHHIHEDYAINHDISYSDDSDFDELIMRHFAAASRARYVNSRGRQRFSGIGPSQAIFSVPTGDQPLHDVQHMHTTSPEARQSSSHEFSEGDSTTFSPLTTIHTQTPSSVVRGIVNMEPNAVDDLDGCVKPSQLLPESPQRPTSSSDFLAFSESIKSKFSAASVRYKESIAKSTRGFKEKLLGHNISVKELGKEVHREMNAGLARMIERLDRNSSRTEVSGPLCSSSGGTSSFSHKEKDMHESVITQSPNDGEAARGMSSAASPCIHSTSPGQLEVPLAQSGN